MVALATLPQWLAFNSQPTGVGLAHLRVTRIRYRRNRRRSRHGLCGSFNDLSGQAGISRAPALVRVHLLASLPDNGDRLHRQSGFLRPAALTARLPLIFPGAIGLWRIRPRNRPRQPVVIRNPGGCGVCETSVVTLDAARAAGVRCVQFCVPANGICLGRPLAGPAPHPGTYGCSVYSADAEFSVDRAADTPFREAG